MHRYEQMIIFSGAVKMMKQEYLLGHAFGNLHNEDTTILQSNPNWKLLNSSWSQMSLDNATRLVEAVKKTFEQWFGYDYVNSKGVLIVNHASVEGCPVCWHTYEMIGLNINGEFWCQFIYQFAHELCHLMTYDSKEAIIPSEIMWLLETICEASSFCTLAVLAKQWQDKPVIFEDPSYFTSIEKYYAGLIESIPDLSNDELISCFLKNVEYLRTNSTDRELNKVFAKKLHNLLLDTPLYWKPIQYICSSKIDSKMSTREMLNSWYQNSPSAVKQAVLTLLLAFGFVDFGGSIRHITQDG